MDVILPGFSVRPFCASLACMGKIGKDCYFEFDPLGDGLVLRALNDAKSAYNQFRYEPAFFEKCTGLTYTGKRSFSDSQESRFCCRVALRALAPILRPRKDVISLRIRSETKDAALYLSFEYQTPVARINHLIKAADATAVSAVVSKDQASEIVASPRVLARLLEPLKQTVEATLLVQKDSQVVKASSFHHAENTSTASANGSNAILQATTQHLLKTETGMNVAELDEFFFRDDRLVDETIPATVNDQVVLVFPIKEAKAMLQFCAGAHLDQELRVNLYFHWGGKPMHFETCTENFSACLVLATLDHKLLSVPAARAINTGSDENTHIN
jgi:hypothetical protein